MLGIPLLSTYIQRIAKEQPVADSVDWLNYYCSSLLLAFFALAISAKQFFGSPINCWVPNEFKSGWERYAEDYCFVANSYYVPFDEEVPAELSRRTDQISYYRWVPAVLAVQALLFWLPSWLWNMLHKQTAVNPRAIVSEAQKSRALQGAEREKEVEALANYISDTVSVFSDEYIHRPCGLNATLLYLGIKLLYALNCLLQLVAINRFLGGQYHGWTMDTALSLLRGEDWHESAVFPRVIMCDFSVRRLANPQRHTVQCVIMLNMINEKLYFFLYFWLMFVGAVTLVNLFYYITMLMVPAMRTKFVARNINKREHKLRGIGSNEIHRFVQDRLRPDGVLLLHFVRQHIGGRVTYDLLNELLRMHWLALSGANRSNGSTASTTQSGPLTAKLSNASSSPPGSEKAMQMLSRRRGADDSISQEQEETYSRQNTYKPTAYGPAALMYPAEGQQSLLRPDNLSSYSYPSAPVEPHSLFNSASLLRALSGVASPTTPMPLNGAGNAYSVPPTLDYIDGSSIKENSSSMNATPLMNSSRRAKSPLVTGLGNRKMNRDEFLTNGNLLPDHNETTENERMESPQNRSRLSEV